MPHEHPDKYFDEWAFLNRAAHLHEYSWHFYD